MYFKRTFPPVMGFLSSKRNESDSKTGRPERFLSKQNHRGRTAVSEFKKRVVEPKKSIVGAS